MVRRFLLFFGVFVALVSSLYHLLVDCDRYRVSPNICVCLINWITSVKEKLTPLNYYTKHDFCYKISTKRNQTSKKYAYTIYKDLPLYQVSWRQKCHDNNIIFWWNFKDGSRMIFNWEHKQKEEKINRRI